MSLNSRLLEEVLEAWAFARRGVIDEISNLAEADLSFRPGKDSKTIAEIGHHIVETGLMMAGELSRADGDFTRKPVPELIREHSGTLEVPTSKAAAIALLERTHADGVKRLRAAGEELLMQPITQFNSVPATRLSWMHHGIAHEDYHCGQLALCARMLGKVPALTQKIMSGT